MQLYIYKDYEALSLDAANEILATVKNNPAAVLCLATGDTPKLAYKILVEKALDEKIDFSACTFIGLDEWIGIPPDKEGSCRFFLESRIFKPLQIHHSQVQLFDGLSADLAAECDKVNRAIREGGGIDLMLVGVGMNGHIGFNEPGVLPDQHAHVINLEDITQSVGQKYFADSVSIRQGITLGLKQVLQSEKLIMMANGVKKAEVMQKALQGSISSDLPASIIRTHLQALAMIDEAAAGLLNLETLPEEVVYG